MKDFKDKVIYQIYPKSFYDSNNDGYGDIKGITEKIPYLSKLGIDMVWISPFFKSPQNDNGYDISDYYQIDENYGTMKDVEEMIKVFKDHNIDLMFDMVFNHTSIDHQWFQKALKGDKKYMDYYYIREPKENGDLPNNWTSKFGGPAWAPFGDTGKYYLCLYDKTQADLNWHNEELRKELYKIVNFWIDKGIKGFRFDVLNVIGKNPNLEDSNGNIDDEKKLYTDTPIVHKFIEEMNEESFGKYEDIITVGEMSSTNIENSILYSNMNGKELSMIFSFHHLKVDYENGEKWTKGIFNFKELKDILFNWQLGIEKGNAWMALFLNNHDQPRANSRFGNVKEYNYEVSTMLAQTIHFMRGTPYIYQGEEIGMTNPNFTKIEEFKDIESINAYKELREKGLDEISAMEIIRQKSRDNSRTPMQWNSEKYGGFSTVKPWIDLSDNYKNINVENNLEDDNSIFYYYKKLIDLRKNKKVISHGTFIPILEENNNILGYIREYKDEKLICLNNFRDFQVEVDISSYINNINEYKLLLSNYENIEIKEKFKLNPYQSIALIREI